MSQLQLQDISIAYGSTQIIQHASLSMQAGEIGCFLGASGCGKTTLLRAIAGFETPTSGQISLAGNVISAEKTHIAPEKRHIGMVFQDFALFPHLTIEDNIGFGLQKGRKKDRLARIQYLLEMIELTEYAKQYPHQLSGGQQQRIALARALAPKPQLLLLDEPFSSLDTETRTTLAADVRQLLKKEQMTAILVTHDQNEAFTMADQIGVLHNAKLLQWDSCYELYHQPKHAYIATFIGEGILLPATIKQRNIYSALGEMGIDHEDGDVDLLVRPEHLQFNPQGSIKGVVTGKRFQGHEYLYQLELTDGVTVEAHAAIDQIHAELDEHVCLSVRMNDPIVFSR